VLIVYVVLIMIAKSNIGIAFKALGQNVEAAQACGIDPTKYRVLNFTISCALAGLVGAFFAHFSGIIIPRIFLTNNTVEVMVISIIGGRGSIWGGLLCSMIMLPIMEYAKDLLELRLILYGFFMIVIIVMYPKGLSGFIDYLRFNVVKRLFQREDSELRKTAGQ